jgi:hypothetical protein
MAVDAVQPPSRPGGPAHGDPADGRLVDRLATQLSTLSEVLETLTVRLLELEERLDAHGQELRVWRDHSAALSQAAGTELRLEDTERRLNRMEALLQGLDAADLETPGKRGLSSVHPLPGGIDERPEGSRPIDAPFPEDGEQPFMDDFADQLIA